MATDFVQSTLSCSPASAGSWTNIEISFLCNTLIVKGELVTVSLPGFERMSGPGTLSLSGLSQNYFSNFYDNCSALLFLTAEHDISSFTRVTIIIPATEGIALPTVGIAADSLLYSLSTNAADILQSSTATFGTIPPVGSFSQSPSTLQFIATTSSDFAQAGEECLILFNFTASMRIHKDEAIRIHLPDFSYHSTLSLMTTRQNTVMRVYWNNDVSQLVITFGADVAAGTEISGTIQGLSVPYFGIQPETSPISISINASAGLVDWTVVRYLHPVGAFLNFSKISFHPAQAASVTTVNITLHSTMRMKISTQITVDLPLFTQDPSVTEALFDSDPAGLNASHFWNETASKLIIWLKDDVAPYHPVHVIIRSDSGIRIPFLGLRENETSFRLSTDAPDGPVKLAFIRCPSPIGGDDELENLV